MLTNHHCVIGCVALGPRCGDAILNGTETCDDGNRVGGDGCNATCTGIEPNYTCPATGGDCERCGNGTRVFAAYLRRATDRGLVMLLEKLLVVRDARVQ